MRRAPLYCGKKITCLQFFRSFVLQRGDRATSSSSASRNGSIDASRLSLEAEMEHYFMLLEGEGGHFANEKKTTCLRFLPLFVAQRATGQRRLLLQVKTGRLMVPDRRQNRKWNVTSCSWQAKLGTLHTERITCFRLFPLFVAQRATKQRLPLL